MSDKDKIFDKIKCVTVIDMAGERPTKVMYHRIGQDDTCIKCGIVLLNFTGGKNE